MVLIQMRPAEVELSITIVSLKPLSVLHLLHENVKEIGEKLKNILPKDSTLTLNFHPLFR